MNILGIETSCDETSAAVVKGGKVILSNIVASSLEDHKKYGGIIPEIASRRQMESINAVVNTSLKKSAVSMDKIHGIAVTGTPGLIGSLLVGLSFARALSFALKKPLIEMDHITAHLYANFLKDASSKKTMLPPPKLPAIGLVVSGGHSGLYFIRNFKNVKLLGQTRDDAAGEAFDKVARILGLGYPGGPIIDKKASGGTCGSLRFPQATLEGSFDFSFSGVKTAVLYYFQKNGNKSDFNIDNVANAFQNSVVSILVKKSIKACQQKGVRTLLVGGGVAANSALRARLASAAKSHNINVFFPPLNLCVDNAAMIAGLAYHYLKK
ncbi:MAG: tRNA (adenosine(37)-N6)-threonylcarbamoyltransferase complex transferase subunit TsaD [Candidatus Omnitrophica bacterium]|nr:tRNA (adenosine(37)-N6)-threonylcarbamoyltransferase complex transferase subunit TsaD [Candidatus Omnitrophota bacterium]